jgi:hypothetical protein
VAPVANETANSPPVIAVLSPAPPPPAPPTVPPTSTPGAPLVTGHSTSATRIDWASLLQHGLGVNPLRCPCGGRLRVIATITNPLQVERILTHLGERTGEVPTRAWDPLPCVEADLSAGDWN